MFTLHRPFELISSARSQSLRAVPQPRSRPAGAAAASLRGGAEERLGGGLFFDGRTGMQNEKPTEKPMEKPWKNRWNLWKSHGKRRETDGQLWDHASNTRHLGMV